MFEMFGEANPRTDDRSYILMQVPSNLFLNKIGKPALYLPTCMVVWVSLRHKDSFKSTCLMIIQLREFYAGSLVQFTIMVAFWHAGKAPLGQLLSMVG